MHNFVNFISIHVCVSKTVYLVKIDLKQIWNIYVYIWMYLHHQTQGWRICPGSAYPAISESPWWSCCVVGWFPLTSATSPPQTPASSCRALWWYSEIQHVYRTPVNKKSSLFPHHNHNLNITSTLCMKFVSESQARYCEINNSASPLARFRLAPDVRCTSTRADFRS